MSEANPSVDPQETLLVPKRRRFIHEYATTPDGTKELRIYFGLKEITFDEPELFAFGERLLQHDRFMAESATRWTEGEPHPWKRVQDLLAALLEEGIIERERTGDAAASARVQCGLHRAFLNAEETRAAPVRPLWWNPDCAEILRELTGRPLELGYLDTVMPVHRIAHPAFDKEDRHVGEINVFPDAMRMKIPTEWRVCNYAGSRYQDDLPMNVTALNSMIKHWRPVLQGVLAVREAFLHRYPLDTQGQWKLGDLHAFGCAVLALPTLLLMRADHPIKNGELDPVLSSLFRVTDGVRMVALYVLFLPEAPRTYDSIMTAAELLAVTEHENHFLSTRGVCAGPQRMVEEFLATMIDGKPLSGDLPVLGDWVSEIPAAIDYGLYGIALYSVIFALWGRMCLAYEKIRAALLAGDLPASGALYRLRVSVGRDWEIIRPGRLHLHEQRVWSEDRYAELYHHAQRGVRGAGAHDSVRLSELLTPRPEILGEGARLKLRTLLGERTEVGPGHPVVEAVTDAVLEYLRVERTALAVVVSIQRKINEILHRPHPERPLAGADLAIHHRLRVGTLGGLPYLMDLFREDLGIDVENTEGFTRLRHGAVSIDLA